MESPFIVLILDISHYIWLRLDECNSLASVIRCYLKQVDVYITFQSCSDVQRLSIKVRVHLDIDGGVLIGADPFQERKCMNDGILYDSVCNMLFQDFSSQRLLLTSNTSENT